MLLAGDIGGTKTVLALISADKGVGVKTPIQEATFVSRDYGSLEAIVSDFLQEIDIDLVTSASFGVAGPVIDNQAEITNLPWIIDATVLKQTFEIDPVHLLNDLEAIANSIPHLETADLITLNQGIPEPTGTMAVIAPGTGLGEAFLTWDGRRYQAHPSEGGHASFSPITQEQQELLVYLQGRYRHVSCERVCSGIGIPNIYQYLRDNGRYPEPDWLQKELTASKDQTPIIATTAMEGRVELCIATMRLFVEILANEAGNMALKVLATGGVYLGGGIPPRILPQLQEPAFMEIFTRKGRFSDLMMDVPVHVIRNPRVALHGAAYFGLENI